MKFEIITTFLEHVKSVVFSFKPESILDPYSFNAKFYQACVDIVNNYISEVVKDFFEENTILRGFMDTSILYGPNLESLTSLNDFRPIFLSNVINKH